LSKLRVNFEPYVAYKDLIYIYNELVTQTSAFGIL